MRRILSRLALLVALLVVAVAAYAAWAYFTRPFIERRDAPVAYTILRDEMDEPKGASSQQTKPGTELLDGSVRLSLDERKAASNDNGDGQQIVGRERRQGVSHHDWSGDARMSRAAASPQPLYRLHFLRNDDA
jgi:HAMP domain-containing protein